ncbi:MAG TPA: hypothetical protein VNM43_00570, partial [Dehalococcoidia bacterium]|nr:hypothetical protein [Dehalococcoidia bacterium]
MASPSGAGALALLRTRVHISRAQLAVLFAILLAIPLVRPVDPDFWWHLRTGDLIVHSGIPRHDPFSWSRAGEPWVAHEWLSEALIYVVQSTLGYWANVVVFVGAAVLALAAMYGLARRQGAGTKALTLLTLLSTIVLSYYVTVRPQALSWLLFAVFVAIIYRRTEGERAPVWLLPPLMALWANLHLGFVYGFVPLGAWLAAAVWDRLRGRASGLREPALIALACVVAATANPQGPALLTYPLRYLEDADQLRFVAEWQRPDPRAPILWPLFLAMGALALALLSRNRPRPFLWLVSLAALALGAQALRNAPYVALLLPAVVGPALAARWSFASAASDSRTTMRLPMAALPALAAFVLALSIGHRVSDGFSLGEPSEVRYPAEALRYVEERHPGARLFNDYTWGGYLIAKGYPDVRVFIDGRTDFYRGPFIDEYVRVTRT